MSEIKQVERFELNESQACFVEPCSDGDLVYYSDYADLEKKYQTLVAEKSSLYVSLFNHGYGSGHHDTVEGQYTDIHRSDITTYHDDVVGELVEDLLRDMPATTQALNEIKAQGVELAAEKAPWLYGDRLGVSVESVPRDELVKFAASLRGE